MKKGKYKDKHSVTVYESRQAFIIQFKNGSSIITSDLSDVKFNGVDTLNYNE